jgi:ribosome-binding ATPase YchF (GTP1/OBG family)
MLCLACQHFSQQVLKRYVYKTAFEAAGCIHSDFQQGVIVAEVVAYKGFVRYE